MSRRPPASFLIRFPRKDIQPWEVPLSILARTLAAVQGLVYADEDEESAKLHLIAVTRGTVSYPVFAESQEFALSRFSMARRIVDDPEQLESASHVLTHMEELSAIAKRLGCPVEILSSDKSDVLVRIEPETYEELSQAVFIHGESQVAGEIVSVGGATGLGCHMRIPQQSRLLICRVESQDVAQQLGQHLYEHAIVTGTATWYRRDWTLHRFIIKAMSQVQGGTILKKLDDLRRIGGDEWSRVGNVDQFIQSIRGND